MALPVAPSDLLTGLLSIVNQLGAHGLLTVGVFVGVIYFLYKGIKLGIHMTIAAIAGGAFPFIASQFLGLSVPVTIQNVTFFATVAVLLYLAAHILNRVVRAARK